MLYFVVLLIFNLMSPSVVDAGQYTAPYSERRTASAVIYQDNDIWGSIVFHQWSKGTPVIISILFNNINVGPNQAIDYAIHEEPVHYDRENLTELCTPESLKSIVSAKNESVGDLSGRHHFRMKHKRFANVIYDYDLSLFEDSPGYIVGKSFVIRQGPSVQHHRCATIYTSNLESQRPGAIPCEFATYNDCLMGAAESNDTCIFGACFGFRQYWGPISHSTLMCKQIIEQYPTATVKIQQRTGVIPCQYGNYTLLKPITPDTVL